MASTHWYSGAYFTGSSKNSTQLSMKLRIPDAIPAATEFYYVLLSAWDNAGSYDQVGIANDYGSWGWTWSYTSYCAGTYNFTPKQTVLQRGALYTFTMNITSSGYVTFAAEKGNRWVGSITGHTGGTAFTMQSTYTCNSATYYDYTDYEEIYATTQSMPSYNFLFTSNLAANQSVTAWSSMGSPPGGGKVVLLSSTVKVLNEGFALTFGGGPHLVTVPQGTSYNGTVAVQFAFSSKNVSLSVGALPAGFTLNYSPTHGPPTFSATFHLSVASTATSGTFYLTLRGTDPSGNYSYLTLTVAVH